MSYSIDDVHYWYCEDCDKRWDASPEITYCDDCEKVCIRAKVRTFTRQDWELRKAEMQAETQSELIREDRLEKEE